ncbi:cytochrome-c peroxidase [Vitiosangium sp. GDMCC 1.1324]|uniref:cytochrome-c peroxidase n=1 Tax=Vitiosangium sp. (strain GDMCC 1.1324) TaxID=2138576 RepID=UPI000D3C7840|nr:cytochrome-c peroxidase [Vitiosangium sp. GDMCC 1.1324]PTL79475.1 cytochrome-c peroxidase [Vitiosangium sp. GDMCC 1.1324]
MRRDRFLACLISAIALGGLAGFSNRDTEVEASLSEAPEARGGKKLFQQAFPNTNGRSCATCHVLDEHTILSPGNVEARLARDPGDPLFNRIDADNPAAPTPTYEHLKKGLVRVVLPLPGNMDVIDASGNVITPPDRKISVWRGVPSIEDTAFTGPYQYDGRAANLPAQAQAAISSHSEGGTVRPAELQRIAEFERSVFSSVRSRFVSELLERGVPLENIPDPEAFLQLNAQEQRGRDLYLAACAACHGGPTTNQITNRAVHDALFFALTPEGNVQYTVAPGSAPVPVRVPRPNDEFLNIGFSFLSYLGQRGQFPTFNASVELPRYRFRFYTDGTRQHPVTELPPIPVTASGDPFDLTPAVDARGAPIVGPNAAPQWFSTDPGRALITGDPADFEAFDVPPLRGIARTAPYFHDNSHATLQDVVNSYSQFVLPFLPDLNLPPVNPPEFPGGAPEALSPTQKQDLIAFLNRL